MAAILRRFQRSVTTCFILEIGDLPGSGSVNEPYVRFYVNGAQVELSGEAYEIAAPWDEADLFGLQFVQVNDVIYITHADYPVHKLTRVTDTSWTLVEVDFDLPPFLDENLAATTITPSGTTGSITLIASDPLFDPLHVGAYFRIGHQREANTLSHTIDANESSSTIEVFGPYTLRSYGTWAATLEFEKSVDGGATWETVHKVVGVSDQNLEIRGEADEESLMRVTVSGFASATDARATIETEDAVIYGFVQITAINSDESATATVKETLYAATATALWAEGAWSAYRGYPRSCTLHESRMVYGGTADQPSTIWGSVVDDYENFDRGESTDSDSYIFTLAGLELNAIQWLASLKALLAGTTGSEWRVIGDELGGIISPTKVSAKQFSYYGSAYVQAETTGDSVIFVERKGRRIREAMPEGDSFAVADLMLLSEHLTEDGYLQQLAWQRDARVLWCTTSDGRALAMTYNREQAVLGWHRHVTDGSFRSVATIYGDTGANDEVWFIVERAIGGTQVFYVERLNPAIWEEREDFFGVDSGLSYDGSPASSFGGLDHLAGKTVVALVDGVVYTGLAVAGDGTVDLPSGVSGSVVHIGLAYTSLLSPFRLDADTQLGVHLGRSKKIDEIKVRVHRSAGFDYDFGGDVLAMKYRDAQDSTNLLGDPEAEDQPLQLLTRHTYDPELTIRMSEPLPLTILALRIGYSVSAPN